MKKKGLLSILLGMIMCLSVGLCVGCGDSASGSTTVPDSSVGLSPASTIFVGGDSGDLVFGISPKDATVSSVKTAGEEVDSQSYTVADGNLTFKKEYLASLDLGEHTFVVKVADKDVSITVTCYRIPSFGADGVEADFNWDEPADVEVDVDLGGLGILGLKIGNETVNPENYYVSGGKLILAKEAVENLCIDGDNTFVLTTNVGSAELVLFCHQSVIQAKFDATSTKTQVQNGEDVTYEFNTMRKTFTIELFDGSAWVAFDSENYSYDYDARTLTVFASWLDEQYAGDYSFRINVADDVNSVFEFKIKAPGKQQITDLAVLGDKIKIQTSSSGNLTWQVNFGSDKLKNVLCDGVAVENGNYTLTSGNFTVNAEFLNNLGEGLHRFTLVCDDDGEDDVIFTLSAGVYGNEHVHLVDNIGLFDFNAYDTGATFADILPDDTELSSWNGKASKEVINDSVMGKALNIPESGSGAGALSFNKLKTDTVYVVRLKFRTYDDLAISSLLWKYNAAGEEINASWIQDDAYNSNTKDYRTQLVKDENNVYTWTSYLPKKANANTQLILWSVSPQNLMIGSIELFETDFDETESYIQYKYADYTNTASFKDNSTVEYSGSGNLYIIQNWNNGGGKFDLYWLECNGVRLVEGEDYTGTETVTLTESFLATLPAGTTEITVCRGKTGILGIDGELCAGSQTATVNIVIPQE